MVDIMFKDMDIIRGLGMNYVFDDYKFWLCVYCGWEKIVISYYYFFFGFIEVIC